MTEPSDLILLDSSALLAYLWAESGGKKVREALSLARKGDADLALSEVSLAEVFSVVGKRRGMADAERAIRLAAALPVRFVACSRALMIEAARMRVRFGTSFGDSIIAATAREEDLEVWTCDPDFRVLEQEVRVFLLR